MQNINDDLILKDYTKSYFEYINQFPVLSKDKLIELFKNHDYETIFYHNLKLVPYIAKRYYKRKGILSFMDLIQEGNIGLGEAITRYKYELNNAFSTYAAFWIEQKISLAIATQSQTISYSYDMYFKIIKITKAKEELQKLLGRPPTNKELSLKTNFTVKKIEEILKHQINIESINNDLKDNERYLKTDIINEEQILNNILLEKIIKNAKLTKNEFEITYLTYFKNMPTKKIAQDLNYTRQNIEYSLNNAINKLKNTGNEINNPKIENLSEINISEFLYYLKINSIRQNIIFFKNFSDNLINRLFEYANLNKMEKEFITLLLGINQLYILSYDDIAKKYNCSYEEVQNTCKNAFHKLADLIKLLYPKIKTKRVRKKISYN